MINLNPLFKIKLVLFLPLCLFLISSNLVAQPMFHISSMIHYELMNQDWPGYDITMIYKSNLGIRYSHMQDVSFLETVSDEDGAVKRNNFEGDLKLFMFLKMLDFKTFQEGPANVFDFITGYVGVGYNALELTLTQKEYYAVANNLAEKTREETVNSQVGALSIGLYGGDSILVIDLRLRYIKGVVEASDYENKENYFDRWMFIVGLGIGF